MINIILILNLSRTRIYQLKVLKNLKMIQLNYKVKNTQKILNNLIDNLNEFTLRNGYIYKCKI